MFTGCFRVGIFHGGEARLLDSVFGAQQVQLFGGCPLARLDLVDGLAQQCRGGTLKLAICTRFGHRLAVLPNGHLAALDRFQFVQCLHAPAQRPQFKHRCLSTVLQLDFASCQFPRCAGALDLQSLDLGGDGVA